MFKLVINGVNVGNYNNIRDMVTSAICVYCNDKHVDKLAWEGRTLRIATKEYSN